MFGLLITPVNVGKIWEFYFINLYHFFNVNQVTIHTNLSNIYKIMYLGPIQR